MTAPRIALLSLACRFPEAATPDDLWRNVLEGRRSFRPIPDSRLPLGDYDPARVGEADSIPRIPAALLTDWEFSRAAYHVPLSTFEATDLTHWLALDVAFEAIGSIGGAENLPRDRTAVVLGDTLTGEFTRSSQIRLRTPYLARKLAAVLDQRGVQEQEASELVSGFLRSVAADFPDPNEESLAGALANTIAGRIANHFDLHGGAWTVDGACASSLLAVADACGRLEAGDIDVAIAGGVDLSLDPFELVGFARAGALARDEMRVFDRRANGFWPGEGCGIAVLATEDGARRIGADPLAWIRGWGVSTDGSGGLTRPTVSGQSHALRRAWRRAELDPSLAGLFEAHGTGTAVGDPTEIRGLADLVGAAASEIPVGSIKSNIGHCKAAAGVAGLIKVAMALRDGVSPPHVGCEEPHPVFAETGNRLAPSRLSEWRGERTAGVSGFGFGGVNAHLVLQGPARASRVVPNAPVTQDAELFVFAEHSPEALQERLSALRDRAATLSFGEMTDAAAAAARTADPEAPFRAALVARRPDDIIPALDKAIAEMPEPISGPPRIAFVFPGQAAPVRPGGGAWARRFPSDSKILDALPGDIADRETATEVAQPAIVAASLLGVRVLARLGVEAIAATGHSLGELCALSWGGALDDVSCLRLATARGDVMAAHGVSKGAMARVPCGGQEALRLAGVYDLSVACMNGSEETVLAGRPNAISKLLKAEQAQPLKVSHAFHSPDMALAGPALRDVLHSMPFRAPEKQVVSTVTGTSVPSGEDLPDLLVRQLTDPVRFVDAVEALSGRADLFIEVGPGAGLSRLLEAAGLRCMSIDANGPTLNPLLETLADLWRRGARFDVSALFADRHVRDFSSSPPRLLSNPCGLRSGETGTVCLPSAPVASAQTEDVIVDAGADTLPIVHSCVAEELGLPVDSVGTDAGLLSDLHLNSLSVGRIVGAAAARLGLSSPAAIMDLSNATVSGIADYLSELRDLGGAGAQDPERVEGAVPWVAEFETTWHAAPAPPPASNCIKWESFGSIDPGIVRGLPVVESGNAALVGLSEGAGDTTPQGTAELLWEQVKAARAKGLAHLGIFHPGLGIEGFGRSLVADGAFETVTMIETADSASALETIRPLLSAMPRTISTWRIDSSGKLTRPSLEPVFRAPSGGIEATFGPGDVALVIGGARGIGAECALRLAASCGVQLALVGRSAPDNPAVVETLERAARFGVRAVYKSAEASSSRDVQAALRSFAKEGLVPTIALHAAGVNHPATFDDIPVSELRAVLSPKLGALGAMLAALDPARLKLVMGFGSIIGALGLEGETHYALANGMMAASLTRWGALNGVRTLTLDWSVWAGAGMGERLGAVERLRRQGVDAIPLNDALDRFAALAVDPSVSGRRIVSSRFGPPPHVRFAVPKPPPLRFTEVPRIHFPGVEIVADAELSDVSDPWLEDHVIDGVQVVPGVMLLEAAAQAALALTGKPATGFEDIEFSNAVLMAGAKETLRVAAVVELAGQVRVVLRASSDNFATDRASMKVRVTHSSTESRIGSLPAYGRQPAAELYGPLFFNAGRFGRVEAMERTSAFSSRVSLAEPSSALWFGAFQPRELVLGDPGQRDSGLHALQGCAPQVRVVPVSVRKITILDRDANRAVSTAREIWSDGMEFCFDIAWLDSADRVVEIWERAVFRGVSPHSLADQPKWMLPAVLERAVARVSKRRDIRVSLETAGPQAKRRGRALNRLGLHNVGRRSDGAPVLPGGRSVSLSHGTAWTIAATGADLVGVDIVETGSVCRTALSLADQALGQRASALPDWTETSADAAIWATREALTKVGAPIGGKLHLESDQGGGSLLMRFESFSVSCARWGTDGCAALAFRDGRVEPAHPRKRSDADAISDTVAE